MGFLANRERIATTHAAGRPYLFKGIKTGFAAVGMNTDGQFSAEGAERRVYGIEQRPCGLLQHH
jgi:hypothetical protein